MSQTNQPSKERPPLHLVGGPTASGKSAAAMALARRLRAGGADAVIINADAMQIYRGLPLLTAQPEAQDRAEVPHLLYEILEPTERSSAGRWLALAKEALAEARAKGATPIVVGGTGLYFAALLGGLADIPPVPENVRSEAAALNEKIGHDAFRERLAQLDPESAARIAANDRQRLLRAYEVVASTGRALSAWQKEAAAASVEAEWSVQRHLMMPERPALYAACDARFSRMVEAGALDEVRALAALFAGGAWPDDLPALKILGVPELAAHLRGTLSLEEAIAKAQQSTRNYAKRQVTWFKHQWGE